MNDPDLGKRIVVALLPADAQTLSEDVLARFQRGHVFETLLSYADENDKVGIDLATTVTTDALVMHLLSDDAIKRALGVLRVLGVPADYADARAALIAGLSGSDAIS